MALQSTRCFIELFESPRKRDSNQEEHNLKSTSLPGRPVKV